MFPCLTINHEGMREVITWLIVRLRIVIAILGIGYFPLWCSSCQAAPIEILTSGDDSLFRLDLPLEILKRPRRNDWRDLRLYNAKGEALRYTLVSEPTAPHDEQWALLEPLSENHERAPDSQLSEVAQLVYDVGVLQMRSVQVLWDAEVESGFAVTVETSDHQLKYRPLGEDWLFHKSPGAGATVHDQVLLRSTATQRYVRLTLRSERGGRLPQHFKVMALQAHGVQSDVTREKWMRVSDVTSDVPSEFVYSMTGSIPVDAMTIEIKENDRIIPVSVWARDSTVEAWKEVAHGTAYHWLRNGQHYRNTAIQFPTMTKRYWKLRFNEDGVGLGHETPQVAWRWIAPHILFERRGDAPYYLDIASPDDTQKSSATGGAVPIQQLLGRIPSSEGIEQWNRLPAAYLKFDNETPPATDFSFSSLLWRLLAYTLGVVVSCAIGIGAFRSIQHFRQQSLHKPLE